MTVALVPLLLALVVPLRPPLRPPALHAKLDFDDALAGILSAAEAAGSLEPVLDEWLEQVDETFVPTLASKLEAVQTASKPDTDEVAKLSALLSAVERRSHERFTLAREQLQDLLGAGEINKLDAKLCKMINDGKLDAGFLYVLQQNDDDSLLKLLTHIHTRTEEELEKRTPPGLALLHKLTRTGDGALRGRILRHYLAPQGSVRLPDGTAMPLDTPGPALVPPGDLAEAIEGAVSKARARRTSSLQSLLPASRLDHLVLSLPIDRAAIDSTVEQVRTVAKEARTEQLDEFTDRLTPVFTAAKGMSGSARS
ncbi:hypothetical protein EMIHUDRAFT_247871 [Emiliania huxleyi CCMP1516]|uniref:Uncharacterized protein n=2 Tax=Emiliania huxleyi TaxID=2903 RepID=A0A0D3I1Y3_EMIH1|nr:hypothetical protein EMIHUDRAFT_198889 [Emiliania huxleyi CCMP1516]XP_005763938.1 hypothetical protein EMIHUDRAFT_247871 [Emiliania huxleyi CCMP1516]EOD05268.1 hypothetical protein EMIHUDRAFT_198889 [Emiliania huxleyi CCMP1516]EOD11509.1 hypothetical protein EMIHUDRAFT_247871 [Emiliania huxleyi CCMP1516]|eukprot:XP_005757697.1 hypothetical protein EMIHUDRAFT_198889 [Emiliania huxleyi CCMP1516]